MKHAKDTSMIQLQDHDNDDDDIPNSYEADGARALYKEG